MAARSRLAERQRAQVRARRGGGPDVARAERFEDGGAAVVHAHHHRGRAAFLGEPSDDGGGAAEAEAQPADVRRADGAHQAGGRQGAQAIVRGRRPVDRHAEASGPTVSVQICSNAAE